MMRMIAALRAVAGFAALAGGGPLVLLMVAPAPVPSRLPSAADVQGVLADPLQPAHVRGGALIGVWLLWALLVLTVLVTAAARLPRLRPARLGLVVPGPVQGLTATVLGAAAVTSVAAPAAAAQPAVSADAVPDGAHHEFTHVAAYQPVGHTAAAPARQAIAVKPAPPQLTCRVRPGDTLSEIAARQLGDSDRWREIYHLNRGTHFRGIGGILDDPDLIYPGWVLRLPAAPAPVGTEHPRTTPRPAKPRPAPHAPASTPADDGTAPSSPAATTMAPTAAPDEQPTQAGQRDASPDGWVRLPGHLLTTGLAAVLLAAALLAMKRRRHRHQPGSSSAGTTPVLPAAVMTALRSHLRRALPARTRVEANTPSDEGAPQPEELPAHADTAPIGSDGPRLAGIATELMSAGLGLRGQGAHDAARGLLVAVLAAGGPDAEGCVVIPAATLNSLIGDHPMTGLQQRLTVTPTFADALATIDEEIIRRNRVLADTDTTDIRTAHDQRILTEAVPPLLLITEIPDEAWHHRLSTTLQLGAAVDVTAAIIGDWPAGTTLTVGADGTTTHPASPTVALLDDTAARPLLAMLGEAHHDGAVPAASAPQPGPPAINGSPGDEPGYRRVHTRVLGTPAILGPDGEPVRGLRAKSLELFVYLVLHRDGAALNDIMEALWPEVTVARATARLSTCAANLRTTIRTVAQGHLEAAGAAPPKIEPVINTGGRYHLNRDLLHVDWWAVRAAQHHADTSSEEHARLAYLQAAVTACNGHGLAEDADYDWIDTDREDVRRRLVALHTQTAALLEASQPEQVRALYDAACTLDPLSDQLARHAMSAAATAGDADAVRARLNTLKRELDDAGIAIDPATEQLAADLLEAIACRN